MKSPFILKRRSFLAGSAALMAGSAVQAAAPMLGTSMARHRRFMLGDFEVTTILANTMTIENDPQSIFGLNASKEDFAAASSAANIPTDKFQMFYTPTVVNTGSELVLFDTGQEPNGTVSALEAAGYSADQIDKVVLTHFHGDHIGGLYTDMGRTFENATYYCGNAEFEDWDFSGDNNFEAKIRPLEDELNMIDPDQDVATGITAVEAFGHTVGHMGYMLQSQGKQLFLGGDFVNHYIWSLAHPDWEVRFDRDREAAAKTRRTLLGMLATDKIPFVGYHMPWPGLGYVETRDNGFHYVPESYQFLL